MGKKKQNQPENRTYTTDSIRQRYNAGERLRFVFFWGHTVTPGRITETCFSQWYPSTFQAGNFTYHTAEQYMMAQKALLFRDEELYQKIMETEKPAACKSLGRRVKNFNSRIWDIWKYQIVVNGNLEKFAQNPPLLEYLLRTGDRILVEASPYDAIWGVHLSRNDKQIKDPNNWQGENLLGFALMETRDQLRTRHAPEEEIGFTL